MGRKLFRANYAHIKRGLLAARLGGLGLAAVFVAEHLDKNPRRDVFDAVEAFSAEFGGPERDDESFASLLA